MDKNGFADKKDVLVYRLQIAVKNCKEALNKLEEYLTSKKELEE